MFNFNNNFNSNNNNNNSPENLINNYLYVCRSHHNVLDNVINSMSSTNANLANMLTHWINSRIVNDLSSNNSFRPSRRRRPRNIPPPPPSTPPPPPTTNTTSTSTSNIRLFSNRNRRRGTFYTPFFPTTTTFGRNNLSNFINTTLWDNTTSATPASINTIINNTKIHRWSDIKNDNPNIERCPIDLSILQDQDIVIQLNHCKHCFKYINIYRWFAINSRCPVCRHDISNPVDSSNNISLNVHDLSNNDISINEISNNDISNNDTSNNIIPGLNEIENIRRRVENLLNLDSSANVITADITFETYIPSNRQ